MKTFKDLLAEIKHYQRTITNYCDVFGIKLNDYLFVPDNRLFCSIYEKLVHDELYDYFIRNKKFVDEFYNDWHSIGRTIITVAEDTKQDASKVLDLFNNGKIYSHYIRGNHWKMEDRVGYFSNYQIIELLTGNNVIERPRNLAELQVRKLTEADSKIEKVDKEKKIKIVGYDDIKTYIIDELTPILNPNDSLSWGIRQPGGILLYGPPGCGKTHWANWIADYLKYELIEIPRSVFGSTYVDGAMKNLIRILDELKSKEKIVVFFDEFDSVAPARSDSQNASGSESNKVVNTLLQEIPKLISKQIVLIAATNFIESLDPAVIRPGRFDLKLPIFPPTPKERLNLLIEGMISDTALNNLSEESPLIKILKNNNAMDLAYWNQYYDSLSLFSNSQILDVIAIIKRKMKKQYEKDYFSNKIKINSELIVTSINESKAKITTRDIATLRKFLSECKKLQLTIFDERIQSLELELNHFQGINKRNPIGYKIPKA